MLLVIAAVLLVAPEIYSTLLGLILIVPVAVRQYTAHLEERLTSPA